MNAKPWRLFPFPTLGPEGHTDGSLLQTHAECRKCSGQWCLNDTGATPSQPKQCRLGFTYARIDDSRVVSGVVASDIPSPTSRTKKRIRTERSRIVKSEQLITAVQSALDTGPGVVESFEKTREAVLALAKTDPAIISAIADDFRRDADENLKQSHDFLQLVKLVKGYAEDLLHAKYPDLSPEEAADKLPKEGAIYYSTTLMAMKVDALLFIQEANRAVGSESRIRIHPLILKYVRIYSWQARQKNVRIHLDGESVGVCFYNQEAIGTVVQALLDNLVKYAPPGSEATIRFEESPEKTRVHFTSLGPRIEEDEAQSIFLSGYRARAARRTTSEGQGIGLAAVRQISDALGLRVRIIQDPEEDRTYKRRFSTTFTFEVRLTPGPTTGGPVRP